MIRKLLLVFVALVAIAGIYFLMLMNATGFFRDIEEVPYGPVYQEIPLKGAEDFTIDYENDFMIISAYDRAGEVRGENPTGGLYFMDLTRRPFAPVRLEDDLGSGFHPHGISLLKLDSSSYQLLVVNHQNDEHTIEQFRFSSPVQLTHERTFDHPLIVRPNDVVAVNATQFYFTNDHKYTEGLALQAENYLGLALANVVYCSGEDFFVAVDGIQYANGINISPDKKTLYVAAPRAFEIRAYDLMENGTASLSEVYNAGTGVDNLEWDDQGRLWTGAHPNLLRFSAYAKLKKETAPSEVLFLQNGKLEQVYLNSGDQVSGSSVALPYEDFLFIGTVQDDKLLVLQK